MPRYFMQLRDGSEELLDPDGLEYADIDILQKNVLVAVRELISEDVKSGVVDLRFRIDAEDRDGSIVYSLAFTRALEIIPEDRPHGAQHG
jgi:hypothetical protein